VQNITVEKFSLAVKLHTVLKIKKILILFLDLRFIIGHFTLILKPTTQHSNCFDDY